MAGHRIVVVGSANVDLVLTVGRFPRPGETVFGDTFATYPGGKGANQAVGCAQLGAHVHFIGRMGRDAFGDLLRRHMRERGVTMNGLTVDPRVSTGTALIAVDAGGQNEITVISGANMRLTPGDIRRHAALFNSADVVVTQLEIPLETVQAALRLGKKAGALTLLNPAPGRHLPASLLKDVDVLTPNETELELLTRKPTGNERAVRSAAMALVEKGIRNVVVTLGSRGSLVVDSLGAVRVPAFRVRPVDTTAAGDAFTAGLAYSLAGGATIREAARFASGVAAIAVTRKGAQTSMPSLAETKNLLGRRGK